MKLANNVNANLTLLLTQIWKAPVLSKYLGAAVYPRQSKSIIFQPDHTHIYPVVDPSALCIVSQLLLSPKVLGVELITKDGNYKEHILELALKLI